MDTAAKEIILEQVKDRSKRRFNAIFSIVNAFFLISQIECNTRSSIGSNLQ